MQTWCSSLATFFFAGQTIIRRAAVGKLFLMELLMAKTSAFMCLALLVFEKLCLLQRKVTGCNKDEYPCFCTVPYYDPNYNLWIIIHKLTNCNGFHTPTSIWQIVPTSCPIVSLFPFFNCKPLIFNLSFFQREKEKSCCVITDFSQTSNGSSG